MPWFRTCGPDYVATAFHVAHQADPTATLVLNDFGFETSSGASFDAAAYRRFLRELDDRDVRIMITELDVLDTGLPASIRVRDAAVADVYARYLDAVGTAVDVAAVMTFGVSDRYTWLQQDYPRRDGAARRPLPFDQHLRPTRAWRALRDQLAGFEPRRA